MANENLTNIDKDLVQDVTDFMNMHILTQMNCMQLSKELNKNGFPGFAWFYQIQANDEFLHQRRCENFLQNTLGAEDYQLKAPDFKPFEIKNAEEGVSYYITMRNKTLKYVQELKSKALAKNNYLVSNFYNWFINDYWSEIDFNNDILDRIHMNKETLAGLDRRMGERKEINPDNVIHPMRGFLDD